MYSLKEEFEKMRPFLSNYSRCTEEEVEFHEKRLNYRLPEPLRNFYLNASGIGVLRPLELLHWDGDYLCYFSDGDSGDVAICRTDDPSILYYFEEELDEDDDIEYYDVEDKMEKCEKSGDREGYQQALQEYYKFWDTHSTKKKQTKMEEYWGMICSRLDSGCLFNVLYSLNEDKEWWVREECRKGNTDALNQYYFYLDYSQEGQEKLKKMFVPITEIETEDGSKMAYVHPTEEVLLFWDLQGSGLSLISNKEISSDLIEDISNTTGIDFCTLKSYLPNK